MNLVLYSYDGTLINDNTNYVAVIQEDMPAQPSVSTYFVGRQQAWPVYAGKSLIESTLGIQLVLKGSFSTQLPEIKALFNVEDKEMRRLVGIDTDDSNKQYYLECTPVSMSPLMGNSLVVLLSLGDPHWKSVVEDHVTWSPAASDATTVLTNGGNIPTPLRIDITPTGARTDGFAYRKWLPILNTTGSYISKQPLDVVNAALNSATMITGGKVQALGQDLRVQINGSFVDSWTGNWNTATSRVWVNTDFPKSWKADLAVAIPAVGVVTEVFFKNNDSSNQFINKIPSEGIFIIGNEAFHYKGKFINRRYVDNVERAVRDTTAAAHAIGDDVRFVPLDIWLLYGDSALEAQETDDTQKPQFDLDTSTNAQWNYTATSGFYEEGANRSGAWIPTIISSLGKESFIYYGDQAAADYPLATHMGMYVKTWESRGKLQPETANLAWKLTHSAGFSRIYVTGKKWCYGVPDVNASWPGDSVIKGIQGSDTRIVLWTEPKPTTANTWQAWSKDLTITQADILTMMIQLKGSIYASKVGAAFQADTVTVEFTTANLPTFKNVLEVGNHYLDAIITNETTGEYIKITWSMNLTETISVDCKNKTVTYEDGTNAFAALSLSSSRVPWLDLKKGANTLKYTETAFGGVTLDFYWEDMYN